jgi:hypothetical protein
MMRRSIGFLLIVMFTSLLSGCILSKSPNADNVTINLLGEHKTFSVGEFPPPATYTWTLDGAVVPTSGNSYTYTALAGEHTVTVTEKDSLPAGNHTATWTVTVYAFNKIFEGSTASHYPTAVLQTSDGGYILAGYTYSYGAGGDDAWMIKTDSKGIKVWDKDMAVLTGIPLAMQKTSDGGYILTGITPDSYGYADAWLIKTAADGNKVWDKTFGGSGWWDEADAVQQTSDGGYILAGTTWSYETLDDFWLIKTDANGNKSWDKTFGGISDDVALAVQQTSDGGYILAGFTASFGAGGGDFWLIKTDANGIKSWDRTFGGISDDEARAVQQTSDGGYILAGYTKSFGAGLTDALLIKTDAVGNKVWDKTFGGSSFDEAYAVQQTSDGGYIMAGYTESYGAGGADAWLIKTTANGIKSWDRTFGGSSDDGAFAVQQTSDGGYILGGSEILEDFLLIKTDSNGNAPATPTP